MTSPSSDQDDTIRVKGPCPTVEQLIRGASGELPAGERERLLHHLALCPACTTTWTSAGGAPLATPPAPPAVAPPPASATPAAPPPAPPPIGSGASASAPPARSRVPSTYVVIFVLLLVAGAISLVVILRFVSRFGTNLLAVAHPVTTTSRTRVTTTTSTTSVNPGLTPDEMARQTGLAGSALGQLRATNEEFRRRVRRQPPLVPTRNEGPRYDVFPIVSGAASTPVRRQVNEPFAIVVHLPPATTSVVVDNSSGTPIWQHAAQPIPTMTIHFPPNTLPPGAYRIRTADSAGRLTGTFLFHVVEEVR